ncbi:MAG: T9SS type A sorting domain-containing protein [Bacteroidota bacterium]
MKLTKTFILIFTFSCTIVSHAQYYPPIPDYQELDSWNGSSWDPFISIDYTFNSNCLPILGIQEASSGQLSGRLTWQYNEDDLVVEFLTETWNSVAMTWENLLLVTSTYSNNNQNVEVLSHDWIIDQWVPNGRTLLSLNAEGGLIENIEQNISDDNSFYINSNRTVYTYQNGLPIEEIEYEWDVVAGVWLNLGRSTHFYNPNNDIEAIISETWSVNQWIESSEQEYTYNSENQVVQWQMNVWDSNSFSYMPNGRWTYSNYSGEYPQTILYQSWIGGAWISFNREERVYPDCLETLSSNEFDSQDLRVYPNPFKEMLKLDVSQQIELQSITVYDITGKSVFHSSENLRQLDLGHLEAGTYILSLQTETEKTTFKIIKQ